MTGYSVAARGVVRPALLLLLLANAYASAADAAPAVPINVIDTAIGRGIGTTVTDVFGDGSNVAMQTSVASVTYGGLRLVHHHGLVHFELQGSVQGTGWGGEVDTLTGPGPTFEAESHYTYDVPFVLRWRPGFKGTLVYYAHGRANLGLSVFVESALGEANEGRRYDMVESLYVSHGALDGGHALFAANLGGLKRDGSFSAIALEGPYAGQPLNISVDAPITRDLAQVAKRLLAKLSGRRVERAIGVGHSGGALIMQYIAGGVSTPLNPPHFFTRVRTGGNFILPYNPSSGPIFDGVIAIAGASVLVDPTFPSAAPMIQIGGEADYAGVDMVLYARRLLTAGVSLNQRHRIYQISDLPHNFAEIVESTPQQNQLLANVFGVTPSPDSDRMLPVVAAMLDNMNAWIVRKSPPPPSRLNGHGVDTDGDSAADTLQFTQANGATTRLAPLVEDPAIDTFLAEQFELSTAAGAGLTVSRYIQVLTALDHVAAPMALPFVQCRVGGFDLGVDAVLRPFSDLALHWKNFGQYRACVNRTMNRLSAEGLYDKQLGKDVVFTDENRALFGR